MNVNFKFTIYSFNLLLFCNYLFLNKFLNSYNVYLILIFYNTIEINSFSPTKSLFHR